MIEFTCRDCGGQFSGYGSPKRCEPCRRAYIVYKIVGTGQSLAIGAVSKAKLSGQIRPASAHNCVDCGASAAHYDHRDYGRPLDVEPVCHSCNMRRGAAKRRPWTFEEFFAYFLTTKRYAHFKLKKTDFVHIRRMHWPEEEVQR